MLPFFNERFGFFGRSKPLPYGQAESVRILAKGEYPSAEDGQSQLVAWTHLSLQMREDNILPYRDINGIAILSRRGVL